MPRGDVAMVALHATVAALRTVLMNQQIIIKRAMSYQTDANGQLFLKADSVEETRQIATILAAQKPILEQLDMVLATIAENMQPDHEVLPEIGEEPKQ